MMFFLLPSLWRWPFFPFKSSLLMLNLNTIEYTYLKCTIQWVLINVCAMCQVFLTWSFFIVVKYVYKIYVIIILSGIKYIHIVVQPSPPSISRNFSSSQTATLYSSSSNSQELLPWPLFYILLTTPHTSKTWNHTVFVLLRLSYFS